MDNYLLLFFSFLSNTYVNLFEKFGYSVLLTYFSEVLLGRLDLDSTLNWEISFDHCTGRAQLI